MKTEYHFNSVDELIKQAIHDNIWGAREFDKFKDRTISEFVEYITRWSDNYTISTFIGCNYILFDDMPDDYFDRFEEWMLIKLLKRRPHLIHKCINMLKPSQWVELIKEHPHLINKCNKLNKITTNFWIEILKLHPHLINYCNKLNKISKNDWLSLIMEYSHLIDLCDKLDEFDYDMWDHLLKKHPHLINYCNNFEYLNLKTFLNLKIGEPIICNNVLTSTQAYFMFQQIMLKHMHSITLNQNESIDDIMNDYIKHNCCIDEIEWKYDHKSDPIRYKIINGCLFINWYWSDRQFSSSYRVNEEFAKRKFDDVEDNMCFPVTFHTYLVDYLLEKFSGYMMAPYVVIPLYGNFNLQSIKQFVWILGSASIYISGDEYNPNNEGVDELYKKFRGEYDNWLSSKSKK